MRPCTLAATRFLIELSIDNFTDFTHLTIFAEIEVEAGIHFFIMTLIKQMVIPFHLICVYKRIFPPSLVVLSCGNWSLVSLLSEEELSLELLRNESS